MPRSDDSRHVRTPASDLSHRASTGRSLRRVVATGAVLAVLVSGSVSAQAQTHDLSVSVAPVLEVERSIQVVPGGTIDLSTSQDGRFRVVAESLRPGVGSVRIEVDGTTAAIVDTQRVDSEPEVLTAEVVLADGTDDAEEFIDASVRDPARWPAGFTFVGSSSLEFTYDPTHGHQVVAVRFDDVPVPAGAHVRSAQVVFTADGDSTGSLAVSVWGERTSDARSFVQDDPETGTRALSSRPRTEQTVVWHIDEPWSDGNEYATVDIATIVQEIVDLDGWEEGGPISILFTGIAEQEQFRRALSFEGSSDDSERPRMTIVFEGVADDALQRAAADVTLEAGARIITVTPYAEPGANGQPGTPITFTLQHGSVPEPVQPEPAEPEPVQPEPVQPEPVEPEPVQPEPDEPEVVEPEPAETERVEPVDAPQHDTTPAPADRPAATTRVAIVRTDTARAFSPDGEQLAAVGLSSLEDATSILTLTWLQDQPDGVQAHLFTGTCSEPGTRVATLEPTDPATRTSRTHVPIAGSAIRIARFIVLVGEPSDPSAACATLMF